MPDPQPTPTDPRPDQAPASNTPDQAQEQQSTTQKSNQKESPNASKSTQQNMGDGAGIRGEYGNASQTNGMEGGPDSPETDTERTGS
ncbi:hypothetical protein GCM10023185_02330 [Hymenobacter saemangeumensis]|uniref:Uncharacterized protein n=1 Tax=Hymenobacter saemangeumensis TaxID=1084522 RepID=A0ABP8HYB2_9BACT